VDRVYFVVVSNEFTPGFEDAIREVKTSARMCQSVSLITPLALLRMLELHFKNPDFTTTEMENILFDGGLITPEKIEYTSE
jgi:hypothetical protein